jgi:hypothetical protein
MSIVLILLPSLLVSAIPIVAGICTARLARPRTHAIALAGIATLSLMIAAGTLAGHASDVSVSEALIGAMIAGVFGSAIPLTVYFELGYRVRSRVALACCWLISAVPLSFYVFIVLFIVVAQTRCAPHQYECPV